MCGKYSKEETLSMTPIVDIVKQYEAAWDNKNEAAYKALLHPSYMFKGPVMSYGPEEAVTMMKMCPMKAHYANCVFMTEGNRVAHMFDWVIEAPFQKTMRMAAFYMVENNQIRSHELFYDTAAFPAEFMEQMKQMMKTPACAV
jgi:hypothetical protein